MIQRNGRDAATIQEVTQLVGVSRRTVYYWLREQKVDAFRVAGGRQYIYVDSLYVPPQVEAK